MKRFAPVLLLFPALAGLSCGNGGNASSGPHGMPADAGNMQREDFEKDNPRWKFCAGNWAPRKSGGTRVLAQTAPTDPWAVAILEDRAWADVEVSVRFRPVSGNEDASGGLIFRAADGKNYFLVRANALEGNFRLYTVIGGRRTMLRSTEIQPPRLGEWHVMRVVSKDERIQAYLDGALVMDHADGTFKSGFIGLWTKADSVTEFDDLEISGAPLQ